MKLQQNGWILLLFITALYVSIATARRGSRKSKKPKNPEPPSWKPNSDPAQGNAVYAKKAGLRIIFKCPADGWPKPKVKWEKNGKPIQKPKSGRIKEKRHTLLLSDLDSMDSGNYTCKVHNKHGQLEWTYMLRVMEVIWPLEVEGPQNRTVYEGQKVTFTCKVINDPSAKIQWLRRTLGQGMNSTVLESEKQVFIPTGEDPERLVIHSATLANSGLYKCLVGNFYGLKYSDAWLNVLPLREGVKPGSATTTTKPLPPRGPDEGNERKTVAPTIPILIPYTPDKYFFTTTGKGTDKPGSNMKPEIVTQPARDRGPKLTAKPVKPYYTDAPRTRAPKRSKDSKLQNLPITDPPPRTRAPKRKDPSKRKDKSKHKVETPIVKEEKKDNPTVYPDTPVVGSGKDPKSENKEGIDDALNDDAGRSNPPTMTISLWTVYIIVGAIAGGILLIGLVTLIVAVACARREDGPYKSTSV